MNLKKESKDLDGLGTLRTQQLPAMRATKLLARLAKSIGPVLSALSELDPNTELRMSTDMVAHAFSRLEPNDVDALIPEIFAMTVITVGNKQIELGKSSNVDTVFSGHLRAMFEALAFVLQVNYADFLGGGASGALLDSQATELNAATAS